MANSDGYMTTTNQANIIPEYWSNRIIFTAYQNMYMKDKLTYIPSTPGYDTINLPTIGNLEAEAVTEGTELVGAYITPGQIQLLLDQQYAVPFTLSKLAMLQIQNDINAQNMYIERAGIALAYQMDVALCGLYSSMSQSVSCTAGLTIAKILEGIEYLDNAGAPDSERYLGISPQQRGAMLQLAPFTAANTLGDNSSVRKGIIGDIFGVNVFVTNNIITTGSTTVTRHNLLFHKQYAALSIQQNMDVTVQKMALKVATDIVVDMVYGYIETYDTFGVDMQTVET